MERGDVEEDGGENSERFKFGIEGKTIELSG
jgi:hypothetical protein